MTLNVENPNVESPYVEADQVSLATDKLDLTVVIGPQVQELDPPVPEGTMAAILFGPRGLDAIFQSVVIPLDVHQVVDLQRLLDRLVSLESLEGMLRSLAYRIHGCADRAQELQDERDAQEARGDRWQARYVQQNHAQPDPPDWKGEPHSMTRHSHENGGTCDTSQLMVEQEGPAVMMDTDYLNREADRALEVTNRVLEQVLHERRVQFTGWRGLDADPVAYEHDDQHAAGDWTRFIVRHLGRAEQALEDDEPDRWRHQMVRVAAFAVAAIEAHDRADVRDRRTGPQRDLPS